jgi:ketosteroid isomerase-like protein
MKARIFTLIAIAGLLSTPLSVLAASNLSAQDYMEIQQLYARYNAAIDGGDAEAYAATFTPDGVFNNFSGHEALVGFIKTWRERLNGANRRHWNANLLISGDGKNATGSVYLMLLDVSTRPATIAATATYTDTLVKTADGWRFTKRETHGDPPPSVPTRPAAPAEQAPAVK